MTSKYHKRDRQLSRKELAEILKDGGQNLLKVYTPAPISEKYPRKACKLDPVDWSTYSKGKVYDPD
jgi:hypothetical protein